MRVMVARHLGFFLLPTIQFTGRFVLYGEAHPWMVAVWFGRWGIQFEGDSRIDYVRR